ncbi:MAG TPA: hypothetical protein VND93_11195 [Myxococcales bacterium]|nr:hypothetical protein [Myxococcales bacterium]
MPFPRRSLPLLHRVALAAVVAGTAACPVGFVDPDPPQLQRLERLWTPPSEDEPTVYALLMDVHLARGADCAASQARIAAQARSALLPPGRIGAELPQVLVSPACRQAPDRHFDPASVDASIRQAEASYGSGRVRALLLYADNIDLPVPDSVRSDLTGLRILTAQRGAPLPLVWSMVFGRAKDTSLFDRTVLWTDSVDASMYANLAAESEAELPLRGDAPPPAGGVPLFTPQEAAAVAQFKGCGPPDSRITPQGFELDGRARRMDPLNPPRFLYTAPPTQPVMKSAYTVKPVDFWVETCAANCDHFARREDGSLVVWEHEKGCVLPARTTP